MTARQIIARSRPRARPALPFLGRETLAPARVHEFCGPARHMLAALAAGRTAGPVFWIAPAWATGRPNPQALLRFFDPGRLVLLEPARAEDLLWTMEEVLRSGAVALTVADLPGPPGLTPVRRLHLAAETGAAEGAQPPLGLILTPGEGGARGVETRWHAAPAHTPDGAEAWVVDRRRARSAPCRRWQLTPAADGFRLADPPAPAAPALSRTAASSAS